MPDLYRAIIKPLVTEKSSALYESRKTYTFRVDPLGLDRETVNNAGRFTVEPARRMTR